MKKQVVFTKENRTMIKQEIEGKNESRQKNEKIKKVIAIPNSSRRIGNKRFTSQSDTHMVMIQTDNAVPRIWVGNISVEMTNFNGPSEREKDKRSK